ncbi:recombinase family protein [Rhodococcus erythropolis]|uniref:recombinase family protein n=1 Tax=Rhodococcus erythropolis TaxID=1833 RepID=UPI001BE6E0ED|nr:recombinase family protein [Rhodococcus erythropolis]MBT2266392.1 recombinase family protein [Rhodococcus erythropolis]
MRAFIYCRISADRIGAGLGVERQRQDCESLAETLGWTVVDTFIDNDLSAYSGKPRPAYLQMLEAIQAGAATAIVAWHTDRLHRSPAELETFISLCDKHSTIVRTVQAGELDLSSPSGQMTARIVGAVARHEIDHARKRMVAAHAQAAENGRAHGKIPFGYSAVRDDSGAITSRVPDAGEAALVQEAVARILGGEATRAVTQDWTSRGIVTRAGKPWNPRSLREMLMRPTLAGLRSHRGSTSKGSWEPIISEDEHVRLVALYSDPSRRTNRDTRAKHLLSGIALCGLCGSSVQWLSAKGYPNYACTGCTRISRSVKFVDGIVEETLIDLVSNRQYERVTEPVISRQSDVESELAALQARMDTAADMLADGDLDRLGYQRVKSRVEPRLAELKKLMRPVSSSAILDDLRRGEPLQNWSRMTLDARRAAIRLAFGGVVLLKSKGKRRDDTTVLFVPPRDL